mmetsp:Transcript_23623/g.43840  ORF Transcript_23623/g.43840 Transcript_23623/m.43840 type:complete len:290 (-) Transcript_23623:1642-2511(-)
MLREVCCGRGNICFCPKERLKPGWKTARLSQLYPATIKQHERSIIPRVSNATPKCLPNCLQSARFVPSISGDNALALLYPKVIAQPLLLQPLFGEVWERYPDTDRSTRIIIIERDTLTHAATVDGKQNCASIPPYRLFVLPLGLLVGSDSLRTGRGCLSMRPGKRRRLHDDGTLLSQELFPCSRALAVGDSLHRTPLLALGSPALPCLNTPFEYLIGRQEDQNTTRNRVAELNDGATNCLQEILAFPCAEIALKLGRSKLPDCDQSQRIPANHVACRQRWQHPLLVSGP